MCAWDRDDAKLLYLRLLLVTDEICGNDSISLLICIRNSMVYGGDTKWGVC